MRTNTKPSASADAVLLNALRDFSLDPERSYTQQVTQRLRDAIVRGTLPPRFSLSEATIAATLEVSRTPVREALVQLADEQLVQIQRKVGTLVAPISMTLLDEGRFARSTLECASHVQLAQTITPGQLDEFAGIVDQQRSAVKAGEVGRLFDFAGRPHVWEMLQPMKRQFDRVRWLLLDGVADHAQLALAEHEQILALMAARDVGRLGAAVAGHIDRVGRHLPQVRQRAPDHFVD